MYSYGYSYALSDLPILWLWVVVGEHADLASEAEKPILHRLNEEKKEKEGHRVMHACRPSSRHRNDA